MKKKKGMIFSYELFYKDYYRKFNFFLIRFNELSTRQSINFTIIILKKVSNIMFFYESPYKFNFNYNNKKGLKSVI